MKTSSKFPSQDEQTQESFYRPYAYDVTERKCVHGGWRFVRILATYTNKCRQLIYVPVGHVRNSAMRLCGAYVVRTVYFIICPPK